MQGKEDREPFFSHAIKGRNQVLRIWRGYLQKWIVPVTGNYPFHRLLVSVVFNQQ